MKKTTAIIILAIAISSFPSLALSIERAPRITDREVVEKLTRLEEGQKSIKTEMDAKFNAVNEGQKSIKAEMDAKFNAVNEGQKSIKAEMEVRFKAAEEGQKSLVREMDKRFEAMEAQNMQLRQDMNTQFDRIDSQFNRLSAMFIALFAAIIGFAIWDRRTMIRPFETKVKEIEDKIEGNRVKLHSLLDAFRDLGKTDTRVAEVLRSFNLL